MESRLPPPLIGWPLLPLPDADGQLRFPTLEQSVRQQIEVILRTGRGEQLMRPDYGAALSEFLHEPNTVGTRKRLHDRIHESLARWEPRILIDRIELTPVADTPTALRVQIAYRLRRSGASAEIGVTLVLENA